MNIFGKLKLVPSSLPHGTANRGFGGFLIDKGERAGFSGIWGFSKGYYGDKFLWKGHGADMWIGGLGTLGLGLLTAFTGGKYSKAFDHIERFTDTGLQSAVGSLCASWGATKAGRSVIVTSAGKNAKTAVKGHDVVGALAAAKGAPYLSANDIANFAQRR